MIIGITGGIASGKSLISKRIESLGYKVYDCDMISHEIFETEEIQLRLKDEFGISSERVSRKEISEIVFNDEKKMKLLNNIMHPQILDEIDKIIKSELTYLINMAKENQEPFNGNKIDYY